MGQFKEITWHCMDWKDGDANDMCIRMDEADRLLFKARKQIYPDLHGYVIRKDYSPEYTSTEYKYITQSDGKRIRVPTQKYHAARYVITIKGVNSKGEEDKGVYDVTPVEYESIEIGDYYIRQKGGVRE